MKMQTFTAKIQGRTALLSHRFSERSEIAVGKNTRRMGVDETITPRAVAKESAYILPTGEHYHPGAAFGRLIAHAAGNHKLKSSRKSAKYLIPAAVLVLDEAVVIRNGDGQTPVKDFEVDSRPVVIPATKGRVMRHRPRYDCWSMTLNIRVDTDLIPESFVHQLLIEGGQQVGIGDFRPEKFGPFGTFSVTSWEPAKE